MVSPNNPYFITGQDGDLVVSERIDSARQRTKAADTSGSVSDMKFQSEAVVMSPNKVLK